MRQTARAPRRVQLARETLRLLDDRRQPGPVNTWPDTMLPNNCHTASCRPAIC